jgi:predicted RNA-binding Zn-ribbon protein involved in translation (DUF1610 family)
MIQNQDFYKFRHNTFHNRDFAWATRIHTRSEVIYQVCPKCGSVKQYPSGVFDVIIEKGSKYPDILGCGAYPFLIVSEKVTGAWEEAGLCCFHTYNVEVAEIRSARLRNLSPPLYKRVEIDGRCKIDLEASGAKIIQLCPDCHHLETEPPVLNSFNMVLNSWDGSSLFRDIMLFPSINFCTQAILDIAFQNKFTNFRFEPMSGPLDPGNKGINYLAGHK